MNRTASHRVTGLRRSIGLLLATIPILLCSASLAAQGVDTVELRVSPPCWVAENEKGDAFLLIYPSRPLASTVTIRVSGGGTAVSGEDHELGDTILRLEPGGPSAFLFFAMVDDNGAEPTEIIELSVTVLDGPARMHDTMPARIYLVDDDSPSRNLLVDPGFEGEATAWIVVGESVAIADGFVKSGSRALTIESSAEPMLRHAYQDVAVVPGALYFYYANIQNIGVDVESNVVELSWLDAAGEEVRRTPILTTGSSDTPGWSYSSNCMVAPPGAVTVRFFLSAPLDGDGSGSLWFDDLGFYAADGSSDVRDTEEDALRLDLSLNRE